MGGALIKNVVIAVILVVLAFVVGSLAADGAKESLGVIAACVGIFVLLYMGKNCWWLIFLLPPVLEQFPVIVTRGLPMAYIVCSVIFVYWLLMRLMGYVRVTWHGVWWMDLATFVLIAYYALTYYWHPVSLTVLGYDVDYVGGKEYVWCVFAFICYLTLSIVPCSLEDLHKVLKYAFFISLICCLIHTESTFRTEDGGFEGFAEGVSGGRYNPFTAIGALAFQMMVCKYSLLGIVLSPWKLVFITLALLGVLMCGFRESLVRTGAFLIFASIVKRQLTILVLMALCCYALLLYLSSENLLLRAPYGVQRVLSSVPGVKVNESIRKEAAHSSSWRVVMWKWALDPRTRYIKDYVWGDGFGQSVYLLKLTTINLNRGRVTVGDQQRFAEGGVWHNGFITSLHRVGIVGWGIMLLWWLCGTFLVLRVCKALSGRKEQLYIMYTVLSLPTNLVWFHISAGTVPKFFGTFYLAAVAKVAYCGALRAGVMLPLFTQKRYIPLMVQDMEKVSEKNFTSTSSEPFFRG